MLSIDDQIVLFQEKANLSICTHGGTVRPGFPLIFFTSLKPEAEIQKIVVSFWSCTIFTKNI